MENGQVVNYSGFEWYVLKSEESIVTLLLKDCLGEEVIKNICDDDEMYHGNRIRHFSTDIDYSWDHSYIRKVLNDRFVKNYLIESDLLEMKTDDGINKYKDKVRLITKDEAIKETMFKSNQPNWTMASYSGNSSNVWFVYSTGGLSYYRAAYAFAVRPIIAVKLSTIDKNSNETTNSNITNEFDLVIDTLRKQVQVLENIKSIDLCVNTEHHNLKISIEDKGTDFKGKEQYEKSM